MYRKFLLLLSISFCNKMNILLAQDKCSICSEYKRKSIEEYDYDSYKAYQKECVAKKVIYYKDTLIVEKLSQSTSYVEISTDYCGKYSAKNNYNSRDKSIIDGYSIEEGDTIFSLMDNSKVSTERMGFIIQYITKNLKYPEEAVKNNIQGKVFVNFTLNEFGDPTKVYAIKAPDKLLADEAVKLIKAIKNLPPVTYKGRNVKMNFTVPVHFKLN